MFIGRLLGFFQDTFILIFNISLAQYLINVSIHSQRESMSRWIIFQMFRERYAHGPSHHLQETETLSHSFYITLRYVNLSIHKKNYLKYILYFLCLSDFYFMFHTLICEFICKFHWSLNIIYIIVVVNLVIIIYIGMTIIEEKKHLVYLYSKYFINMHITKIQYFWWIEKHILRMKRVDN